MIWRVMAAPTLSCALKRMRPSAGSRDLVGGLADVVEEDGEDERDGDLRGEQAEHGAGVDPDVALGMKLRRLLAALEREKLRDDLGEEAALVEQVEAADTIGREENADEFLADALGADVVDFGGVLLQRVPGGGIDFELEHGGEADGAQHAEAILAEAARGVADGAQKAAVEIGASADEIDDLARNGIVEHAVYSEVAALRVFARRGEGDGLGVAAIDVSAIGAECGDLELMTAIQDANDAEVRTDGDGAREEALHLLRACAGGHVIILCLDAEEHVAHAAAGVIGVVAGVAKTTDDAAGNGFEVGHGRKTLDRMNRIYRMYDISLTESASCILFILLILSKNSPILYSYHSGNSVR